MYETRGERVTVWPTAGSTARAALRGPRTDARPLRANLGRRPDHQTPGAFFLQWDNLQWDDSRVPRAEAVDLFDAIGGGAKRPLTRRCGKTR